ncbi:MAG: Fic family protein [Patescibacteria group bacterium]
MKAFHPNKLPQKFDYSIFARELSRASFEIGKLDIQKKLPNPQLLIAPLTLKEATTSSKIEGTRSTVSDVARLEAGIETKYADTKEVLNYRRAMLWAIKSFSEKRPLSLAFMKELHDILLDKTRGYTKKGKFRTEQVFIGDLGVDISKATYIPPEPIFIQDYMENLEKYIIKTRDDNLVKAAIIHYQFEAIHPFSDGNGRIGRLLIPLFLFQKNTLFQPILYLSGYFDENRTEYLKALHRVDTTRNYEGWVKFFLRAVAKQSKETIKLVNQIDALLTKVDQKTDTISSSYTRKFTNFIFTRPIFTSKDVVKSLKVDRMTASRLIKKYHSLKIVKLVKSNSPKKNIYVFDELLVLL